MEEKKAGQWDYSGSCAPARHESGYHGMSTFTLGIFQWIPKSKKGVKKANVQIRVVGKTSDPRIAYERADHICRDLNAGKPISDFKKRIKA